MPADRAEKNSRRLVRKNRYIYAKSKAENRSRVRFFGSMDGAPDDQLSPNRPPTAWHVVAVAVGTSHAVLMNFITDMCKSTGRSDFRFGKWNGGTNKTRPAYQAAFMRGFTAALVRHPKVTIVAFACQALDIQLTWQAFTNSSEFTRWGQLRTASNGKEKMLWRNIGIRRGQMAKRFDLEMDTKRAAVLGWITLALARLYRDAERVIGHRPHWDLLCDRLPSDPSGKGFGVLTALLQSTLGDRLTIHHPATNFGPDAVEELLADCVVTWARDFLEKPGSPAALGLQAIFDDPILTKQFHLERQNWAATNKNGADP